MEENEELMLFITLKERLVAQLQQYQKVQKLQIEMLSDVEKVSARLANIQQRHPSWKVAQENKELLKAAGVWTRLTYSSLTGVGLR